MFRTLKLYQGQQLDMDMLTRQLVDFGYSREAQVQDEGDFSRRGGIVDIFPTTFECPIRIEFKNDTINSIKSFALETGISLWPHEIAIILPKKMRQPTRIAGLGQELPLANFLELQVGDYVVHVQHGIGIYKGRKKIKHNSKFLDHLVIGYQGQDKLFVPVSDLDLVQKYIGFSHSKPSISKLGSKKWLSQKIRAQIGAQKLARELLEIHAMRQAFGGFRYCADTEWQAAFEKTFPYKETPDQIKATDQLKQDMQSGISMDRLICGDVGYGKTEVAMRAAFKTVMDNKQVAFLVPTTILAEQHYQNFLMRLKAFPFKIAMLSRFNKGQAQKEIIQGLAEGRVDIVIGTHRLLSGDIKFKDLGLVIIDEEQRFGVVAKEKLKKMRFNTNVLTLTATPIPRTLYMSLMEAKDISIINTAPQDRLSVDTHILEFDEEVIRQAIKRELIRKGQVYFVHNHIMDIEKIADVVTRLSPSDARISIAHGQLDSSQLEMIMLGFLKGDIDILVSTVIIESGIDVPNANTLIVNNADAFGLADLHQLRGRVGRFIRKAYAYFFIAKETAISDDAKKRLKAIEEYWHLGSGFKIAMQDLEIRGAGNLLGTRQHGFIEAVGFDLYCRMLREAIAILKVKKGKG